MLGSQNLVHGGAQQVLEHLPVRDPLKAFQLTHPGGGRSTDPVVRERLPVAQLTPGTAPAARGARRVRSDVGQRRVALGRQGMVDISRRNPGQAHLQRARDGVALMVSIDMGAQ